MSKTLLKTPLSLVVFWNCFSIEENLLALWQYNFYFNQLSGAKIMPQISEDRHQRMTQQNLKKIIIINKNSFWLYFFVCENI